MESNKKVVQVNGKDYEIPSEVSELIGKYHTYLKYLHDFVKDSKDKIPMTNQIGDFINKRENESPKEGGLK